jgi:hypothetical protein
VLVLSIDYCVSVIGADIAQDADSRANQDQGADEFVGMRPVVVPAAPCSP